MPLPYSAPREGRYAAGAPGRNVDASSISERAASSSSTTIASPRGVAPSRERHSAATTSGRIGGDTRARAMPSRARAAKAANSSVPSR